MYAVRRDDDLRANLSIDWQQTVLHDRINRREVDDIANSDVCAKAVENDRLWATVMASH